MHYRLYTPADFSALYAIEEECFPPPLRFGRAHMRRLVASSNTATWIAEDEGRITGFAIVEWTTLSRVTMAYIQTLEVSPAMRARGMGSELLKRMERSASAAGAGAISLHVDASNASAIRLYEAHGYHCEAREENYYPQGHAALLYLKALEHMPEGEQAGQQCA